MSTEENKVKKGVKEFLHSQRVVPITKPISFPVGYYYMPVQTGYGSPTLDFIGHYRGIFFAVETKRLGDEPTPRQNVIIDAIRIPGGRAFWGDNVESIVNQLANFMAEVDRSFE